MGLGREIGTHRVSTHAEFARRCDRSPKLISEIIAGKAPIVPQTAFQFELVLGVSMPVSGWVLKPIIVFTGYGLPLIKTAEAAGLWSQVISR